MDSFSNNKYFLIVPRNGDPFVSLNDENQSSITIEQLAKEINNHETQSSGLEKIGITLRGRHFFVEFKEIGYPYSDLNGNRSETSAEQRQDSFSVRLPFEEGQANYPLKMKILLNPYIQDHVCNFLGKITIELNDGLVRSIPLVGKGTATLEGRMNDCYAGVCIGASCASFQQKVAIICAAAKTSGVRVESFELLQDRFRQIDQKYHGRADILEYTFLCTECDNVESYVEYMKRIHQNDREENRLQMLDSVLAGNGPDKSYYENLEKTFTKSEIEAEKSVWRKMQRRQESSYSTSISLLSLILSFVILILGLLWMKFW